MPHAAISRLVSELTEEKVRRLLVELLSAAPADTAAKPRPRIRSAAKPAAARSSAKAKRLVDAEKRARYSANRKAKRAAKAEAARVAAAAPVAVAEPAPKAKQRRGTKYDRAKPKVASNGAGENWKQTAREAVSAVRPAAPAS